MRVFLKYLFIFRGNSKYHYYGIRVKPGSSLMNLEDQNSRVVLNSSNTNGKAQGTVRPFKRSSDASDSVIGSALSQHVAYLGIYYFKRLYINYNKLHSNFLFVKSIPASF